MNKTIYLIGAVILTATLVLSLGGNKETLFHATLHKDANCGCCGIYSQYLNKQGADVDVVNGQTSSVKMAEGVPSNMRSCHTTLVGDYFVEGHVPLEAIQKLLEEKPNIKGIALPGMPTGSPGMPGAKSGPFVVYAVNGDGSVQEFMRV